MKRTFQDPVGRRQRLYKEVLAKGILRAHYYAREQSGERLSAQSRRQWKARLEDWRIASEAGDAGAAFMLGLVLLHGDGVRRNKPQAIMLIERAVKAKVPSAQAFVGMMGNHSDVAGPWTKRERWKQMNRAAEAGVGEALCEVGYYFFGGIGVRKDTRKAAIYYRKGADQGDDSAAFNLGLCYLEGEGVARSLGEARRWLKKAAKFGNEEAKSKLRTLKRVKKPAVLSRRRFGPTANSPE